MKRWLKQFKKIIEEANFKWSLIDTLIIHRYGKLQVNDKIVLVSTFHHNTAKTVLKHVIL
jgi:molybdopterin synthase catalytic subunit